jgi:DNA-binding response OmpR family regulator
MHKILIVEDEKPMLMGLRDNLEFEGYEVDIAEEGDTGLKKIMENSYDLVVLDVMLPNMSGFDVCREARSKGVSTPIILLTAKGEEIDKVLGLELGADDYMTKPFSLRELLARIKAVLRRVTPEEKDVGKEEELNVGRLQVNYSSYEAFVEDAPIRMSHKEFDFLRYLWDHRNQVVSRDDLLDNVWGTDYIPSSRTVDNFILKLRQRVEKDPNNPKIILTVHGVGYKLVAH